jgi:hypothetical protein
MGADTWWGWVAAAYPHDPNDRWKGGSFVVTDPRWPDLPAIGSAVEVRIVNRSPYWSLVEDDQ